MTPPPPKAPKCKSPKSDAPSLFAYMILYGWASSRMQYFWFVQPSVPVPHLENKEGNVKKPGSHKMSLNTWTTTTTHHTDKLILFWIIFDNTVRVNCENSWVFSQWNTNHIPAIQLRILELKLTTPEHTNYKIVIAKWLTLVNDDRWVRKI